MSVQQSLRAGCVAECHGCRHRQLDGVQSLAQKQAYLARALEPWADLMQPVRAVHGEARYGYRDRVTLNVRWDATAGWRFGLMRRDELIAIHDCPVHSTRVNRLVGTLRRHLPAGEVLPLAYLHVAGGQATLVVKARNVDVELLQPLLEPLGASGLDGLWLHCHPAAGRRLFARAGWHLLWGEGRSLGRDGLWHGPTSFQQLLPALHGEALALAVAHLRPTAGRAVLDLYCGIGRSLARWRTAGATALGVELGGDAVESASRNVPGAEVLRGTCVQRLPQVRQWWAAQPGERLLYVNPPRSGLEPALLAAVAADLRPQRFAYLSCSAGTLARDLTVLESAGYRVAGLVPFDFFPGTQHVEVLAMGTLPPGA